jgi:hypothetical protein
MRRRRHRREIRRAADQNARYSLDEGLDRASRPCRITNLSTTGAAFDLIGGPPIRWGDRMTLELDALPHDSVGLLIHASVRHLTTNESGGLTVGVEFLEPNGLERSVLDLLIQLRQSA